MLRNKRCHWRTRNKYKDLFSKYNAHLHKIGYKNGIWDVQFFINENLCFYVTALIKDVSRLDQHMGKILEEIKLKETKT